MRKGRNRKGYNGWCGGSQILTSERISMKKLLEKGGNAIKDLFQKIGGQHENLGVVPKALHSAQVSHPLLVILGRRHDLEDMERGP